MLRAPLLFVVILLFAALPARGQVESVRVVGDGEITRITLWLDEPATAQAFLGETTGAQQVLLAFDGTGLQSGAREPVSAATGVAAYGWQDGFFVFTLARPMMVMRQLDLPSSASEPRHRIVLDLAAVSDVRFARAAEQDARGRSAAQVRFAASSETVEAASSQPPSAHDVVLTPRDGRYLIVIDPGHGGRDPGATAANGIHEKAIVLDASRYLADILEESGRYRTRLTRTDDTFLELEERVSLAREWGADLFISIHADAAQSPSVSGASVYTLSSRGETRINREVERNDWTMPIENGVSQDVSSILSDFLLRETRSNSGLFAELLIPELAEAGPVLRNTHRTAGFYVLLAPDVPAVLLEIGFLTNSEDAARLSRESGRQASMRAVRDAIDAYFDHQDVVLASH